MTSAELIREYSWALILVVMLIYVSLRLLQRWLANRREKDFGEIGADTSPEDRARRMRYLTFFALLGIISFTAVAIMNSF